MPLIDHEQRLAIARCKLAFVSHALSWPPDNSPVVLGFPELAGLSLVINEVLTVLEETLKMIRSELASTPEVSP
jgi:hypothetical protein